MCNSIVDEYFIQFCIRSISVVKHMPSVVSEVLHFAFSAVCYLYWWLQKVV
jgi:hypothetical protein